MLNKPAQGALEAEFELRLLRGFFVLFCFLRRGLTVYLGWSRTHDLPASVSLLVGIIAMHHHAQLNPVFIYLFT
jgi:hypothetical protein